MAKQTMDLRVRLTRKVIKDALIEAMKTQHISSITVRQLCDAAGINRSTFYTHYNNTQDLLHQVEQEMLENFEHYLESDIVKNIRIPSTMTLLPIFDYAKENADLLNVLLSENCDFDFQNSIMDLVQNVFLKLNKRQNIEMWDSIAIFSTAGSLSVLKKWLRDGMQQSSQEISEFIHQIIYHGITSFE